ncbi:sialic acid-binding Ig-like lectin 12 [Clupea harengus]|uniref:Sialic acid-binding Ig-like lectin 12 n=1 Tax=Clupea harengus TaxID=7950 RepID=A0A6P8G304_CLUHA|nr:sialic acid-binding Ig-like lectin 12 [Clupea harengus]
MLSALCFGVMMMSSIECSMVQPEPKGYGSKFSISVPSNITVEAGLCVKVSCTFTYPPSTITEPYERVWFKGDPPNPFPEIEVIRLIYMLEPSERECSFILKDARKGRTDGEYGFMLKWGNNQHVFSETVHITVTGISSKPDMDIPPLTENQSDTLRCTAPGYCSGTTPTIKWKGKAVESFPYVIRQDVKETSNGAFIHESEFSLIFDSTYHNTVLTCMIVYMDDIITEQHVTLIVRYAPKIENGSKCSISEHLSTCVCISHGVPLPIITWPLGLTSQDYNMTTSVSDDTVTSTITTSAALLRGNDTVMCLSKNELGQASMTLTVNFTKRGEEDPLQGPGHCNLPWTLASLSVTLNGFLFLGLFLLVVAWKRSKAVTGKEESQTYSSLAKRDESVYDTISQRP